MKYLKQFSAIAALSLTTSLVQANGSYTDSARVIHVKPVYKSVKVNRPSTECWSDEVRPHRYDRHQRGANAADVVIGGIVGGVIGHQFGSGRSRDVATVAGSIVGATLAGNHNESRHRRPRHERTETRHCRTRDHYHYEERLQGYTVRYKYKGEVFSTFMHDHPGERIRIRVKIRALDD